MRKALAATLKSVAALAAAILLLAGAAFCAVQTDWFQQKMLKEATRELSERLGTRVEIDSVSMSIATQRLRLHGVEIEDRQKVEMLSVKELAIDADLWELLRRTVKIEDVRIKGAKARLYLLPDSTTNFHFIAEAIKGGKKPRKEEKKNEPSPVALDLDRASIEDINISYGPTMRAHLQRLVASKDRRGKTTAEAEGISATWVADTKKGPVANAAALARLELSLSDSKGKARIEGARFTTDNHKPRRNAGRPKRGYFDAKHLDIAADINLDINYIGKDSANVSITGSTAADSVAGLLLKDLNCTAAISKRAVRLSDFSVSMKNTRLAFSQAEIQLPDKKEGRKMQYHIPAITGQTVLKDIARPFAPVLKNFTTPLFLTAEMSGTADTMTFRGVHVASADKGIDIHASGHVANLKEGRKLAVAFHVGRMRAKNRSVVEVIHHFPVKKLMMDELRSLGDIGYAGDFGVYWKREAFSGQLTTQAGDVGFRLSLDEQQKYIDGTVSTTGFRLGQMIGERHLSPISCHGTFRVDFSKERTARMRRQKGGRLPIGKAELCIDTLRYGIAHLRGVTAAMESDGATASGSVASLGKRTDVFCDFSYTNTTGGRKTSFKPRVKLHKKRKEQQ